MPSKKKSEVSKTIVEKEPVIVEEKDILTEEEVKDLKSEEVAEVKAPKVEVKKQLILKNQKRKKQKDLNIQ